MKSKNFNLKYHFVYKTTNLINGKVYIGKHSSNILDDNYLGSGVALKSAIAKYGRKNFKREIIEICESFEDSYLKERQYIELYNAVDSSYYYNLKEGGFGGRLGEESIEKLKETKRNNPYIFTEEVKNKMSKPRSYSFHTDEEKMRFAEMARERFRDPEIREMYRLRMLGENNYMIKNGGHSKEVLESIRLKKLNYRPSEECKRKQSIAMKNQELKVCPHCGFKSISNSIYYYHFDNCKAIHNNNDIFKKSEETREKMSKSWEYRDDIVCPWCNKKSKNKTSMNRWHFDNCKQNPNYKKEIINCPWCDKYSINIAVMKRHHFDNCKHKPSNQ